MLSPRDDGIDSSQNCFETNADGDDTNTGVINGTIESTFGHTGKVKLHFDQPIFAVGNQSNRRCVKRKDQIRGRGVDAETNNLDERLLYRGRITMTLKKYPLAAYSIIVQ